jgi:hypothetical protein
LDPVGFDAIAAADDAPFLFSVAFVASEMPKPSRLQQHNAPALVL